MTADERTCAQVVVQAENDHWGQAFDEVALREAEHEAVGLLAAIHPDLPAMPVATLRRYIAVGRWVDEPTVPDGQSITVPMGHLRSIGAEE